MEKPEKHMKRMLIGTSRSFYLTLKFLPSKIRNQIVLMYLLARLSDTIADSKTDDKEYLESLLESYSNRIQQGRGDLPNFIELANKQDNLSERELLLNSKIPIEALENSKIYTDDDRMKIRDCLKIIISGQTLDLKRFTGASEKSMIGLRNEKELDEYTYMVAGCVGEFWTHMTLGHQFKLNQEKEDIFFTKAVSFGKALQLINILRDLPEDLRMGRCYIPIEELSKHNLIIEDLLESENIIKFKPIFDSYIDKTDNYLDEAIEYIEMIPKYQFRLRLSCMVPVIIGQKTLNLLRNGNILDSNNRIKVDRSEIKKVVRKAAIASISKKNSLKLLKKYK